MGRVRPQLLITTDAESDRALVRGVEADMATRVCCPDTRQYNRYPRGWIVPLADIDDLLAYGQHYRVMTVCHPLKKDRRWVR